MPVKTLVELVDKAVAARDSRGPAAAAERLILFASLVSALQQFVSREASRLGIARKVRSLSRELAEHLREIEIAASPRGPALEQVTRYYETLNRLQKALSELDAATTTITVFDSLPLEK